MSSDIYAEHGSEKLLNQYSEVKIKIKDAKFFISSANPHKEALQSK